MGGQEVKNIFYAKEFVDYTDELLFILYFHDYFGFIESAEEYINNIYDFIEQNIDTHLTKPTPEKLKKYGEKYLLYKAKVRTTWHIFFTPKPNGCYVDFNL